MIDIAGLRQDHTVPAVIGSAVKLKRVGSEWKGCCPFHRDRSPSFTVFDGGKRWHCFGCGASGDVLDYVQRAHGVTLTQAAEMLAGRALPVVQRLKPLPMSDKADRSDEARAIWVQATSIVGTPAESYLRGRGIHTRLPESLRFARLRYGSRGDLHPCLVALVASVDNQATGIQRTYLNAAGSGKAAVPKPKLSLGRVAGGAIRLAPCADRLVVCEGLEDGLSLQQGLGLAVWVAAGASMLPAMQFPAGMKEAIIGADGDDAGEAAARKAAVSFTARGITARIIRPLEGFKDFNDELRGVTA